MERDREQESKTKKKKKQSSLSFTFDSLFPLLFPPARHPSSPSAFLPKPPRRQRWPPPCCPCRPRASPRARRCRPSPMLLVLLSSRLLAPASSRAPRSRTSGILVRFSCLVPGLWDAEKAKQRRTTAVRGGGGLIKTFLFDRPLMLRPANWSAPLLFSCCPLPSPRPGNAPFWTHERSSVPLRHSECSEKRSAEERKGAHGLGLFFFLFFLFLSLELEPSAIFSPVDLDRNLFFLSHSTSTSSPSLFFLLSLPPSPPPLLTQEPPRPRTSTPPPPASAASTPSASPPARTSRSGWSRGS